MKHNQKRKQCPNELLQSLIQVVTLQAKARLFAHIFDTNADTVTEVLSNQIHYILYEKWCLYEKRSKFSIMQSVILYLPADYLSSILFIIITVK